MRYRYYTIITILLAMFLTVSKLAHADIVINILAVNGTESEKEKMIDELLPKEIKADDVLDTAGLELNYDVDTGSYKVTGIVELEPKESRTLRVRVRDVWVVDIAEIQSIKDQIDINYERVKDTEFEDSASIKKESLIKRLDFILAEQERSADNAGQRIDKFRTYAKELKTIRNDAVSIKYWRSKPPSVEEANIFRLILQAENPSNEKALTKEQVHYLPKEVKPEHLVERAGFEVRYDAIKGQSFLWKEEELQAGERKRYEISIIDIWNIKQQDIENLQNRTRETYRFLENTKFVNSADFLVSSIKENLEGINQSQAIEKDIRQHIQDYRTNLSSLQTARNDVKALEELLEVVREKLVRSRLENVLEKIRSLKSVKDVANAFFDDVPSDEGGKRILWVIGLVGVFTIGMFFYWMSRSKEVVIEETEENIAEKEEAGV